MRRLPLILTLTLLLLRPLPAQQTPYPPVFDYESVLDTYFDDSSGLISFTDYVVGFAPDAPFNAQIAVVDSSNTVLQSFSFFPDYKLREGVFARAMVQGPADITLTQPGVYNIVFLIDGKPATRLGVILEQTSAGDDPFNPEKTYQFYGLWQKYAHLTMTPAADSGQIPQLNFWLGGRDLPDGESRGSFLAELYRDGQLVAHSKRNQGHIAAGHYKRTKTNLFHPHEPKAEPNAQFFKLTDWLVDGPHELRITRQPDGAPLRSFDFDVKDAKIVELPQTQLSYEPHIDYIMPRVVKKGSTAFELTETIWLLDKD